MPHERVASGVQRSVEPLEIDQVVSVGGDGAAARLQLLSQRPQAFREEKAISQSSTVAMTAAGSLQTVINCSMQTAFARPWRRLSRLTAVIRKYNAESVLCCSAEEHQLWWPRTLLADGRQRRACVRLRKVVPVVLHELR